MMSLQLQRDHVQLQRNDKVVTNFSDVVAGCWFEALRRKRPVLIHLKYMASRPLQKSKGRAAGSGCAHPLFLSRCRLWLHPERVKAFDI